MDPRILEHPAPAFVPRPTLARRVVRPARLQRCPSEHRPDGRCHAEDVGPRGGDAPVDSFGCRIGVPDDLGIESMTGPDGPAEGDESGPFAIVDDDVTRAQVPVHQTPLVKMSESATGLGHHPTEVRDARGLPTIERRAVHEREQEPDRTDPHASTLATKSEGTTDRRMVHRPEHGVLSFQPEGRVGVERVADRRMLDRREITASGVRAEFDAQPVAPGESGDELESESLGSTTEGLFGTPLVLQKIFVHLDLHRASGTDAERPPIVGNRPIRRTRRPEEGSGSPPPGGGS